MKKGFVCYWFFVGWDCISLGFHVCFSLPNIEIHLPFGFFRIGWEFKQGKSYAVIFLKEAPKYCKIVNNKIVLK